MKKKTTFWLDFKHDKKDCVLGIECSDPKLTFDGHFVCILPDNDMDRAEKILKILQKGA